MNSEVIMLTEQAAKQVVEMMQSAGENLYLRVGVQGGGCSGFSYELGFDDTKDENDMEFEQHGVRVLMDSRYASMMQGTVLDYQDAAMGGGFVLNNPNATSTCGCGSSFRTEQDSGNPSSC